VPPEDPKLDGTPLRAVLEERVRVGGIDPGSQVAPPKAVGGYGAGGEFRQLAAVRVVVADDEVTVGGKGVDVLREGLEHVVEGRVEVRMVELDVGDDGGLGAQVEERAVGFVGLGDKEVGYGAARIGEAHADHHAAPLGNAVGSDEPDGALDLGDDGKRDPFRRRA